MNIVIIGPAYPYRGGLSAYNERLARAFEEAGHTVTIYTFSLQYPQFLFPGKSQFLEEKPTYELNIKRAVNSVNPLNWLKVGNEIKKLKPDFIICKYWLPFMGPAFGTILRQAKKNKHTKVISILDNIIPHESRIGDKPFTKYFVKPIDGFISMSKKVHNDLSLFETQKPRLISPHPIFDNFGEMVTREEALNYLKLDPKYNYMLFFGLIRDYKGLDLLLDAFAEKALKDKDIKLIIAGEYYTDKKPYLELIEKYQLEDRIIQAEKFIQDSEVKYYFCAADLVVQPYKTATQSGVTQIAYHFNKPMIVTDVGGLKEMCPDGKVGYVVPVDKTLLAEAILKFFNENQQEKMIAHIKEEKKKYSWEILVENVFALHSKIESNQ
ncbi:glycosyltransferase [Brumimicrobium oceani]|uniref:Glycosyl transferase family 1 n=1 Tax=Brumimicrobium oceani TaxID=2100725 RepID=A0A2U2XFX2_9FLAO|nr:glycosyltransferase [Brumimicrobium oceani]PWH86663.1 glycosyl transferase family 1 [Brumimicrobium oceani]